MSTPAPAPSSIYNLEATKELVDQYNNFRRLQATAVSVASQLMNLSTLIQANPLFSQNVSAAQMTYFTAVGTNAAPFVQAAPVDPDVPVPVSVAIPAQPTSPAQPAPAQT